jgi:two-component system, NarL family, nitrate/nitrite response regulator NarL
VKQKVVRVLIVEDHRLVAETFATALGTQPDIDVVGVAGNIAEANAALEDSDVDVILLDQRLPDGFGTDAAAKMIEGDQGRKVLMVSASNNSAVVEEALRVGCSGFVSKSSSVTQLREAIRSVWAGSTVISPEFMDRFKGRARRGGMGLSQRQIDVLRGLAEGLNSEEIAESLFLSVNTVRNHIQLAIEALECHSRLQAVAEAIRMGLIEGPE